MRRLLSLAFPAVAGLIHSLVVVVVAAAAADGTDVRDLPVTRKGPTLLLDDKPWKAVGPNVYWLGLDENVTPPEGEPFYEPLRASYPAKGRVSEIMAVVRAMGGTMIRSHTLGVSTGNPLSLYPSLNKLNPAAFEPIDWAIYQAREHSVRLMIPLTDNFDYYHGGKYNWMRWRGFNLTRARDESNPQVMQFYLNRTIIDDFKGYIRALLTHVNPYTNLTYAEDPTVFAYETGNELCGPAWKDMNVPVPWVREIGQLIKELAPNKLFVDGTYGVNRTHFEIDEVDIFSNHYYPISISKLRADLELMSIADRPYFAGEYTWLGEGATSDANLTAWFREIETSPSVAGDAFWSLFGHNVPDCSTFVEHDDGLTMHYGNPAHETQIKLVRQHFVKMSQGLSIAADEALPPVPCPVPSSGSRHPANAGK
ncbi:mannan endo-1,4-beta-mannosidase [Madurella fahalii]|uniref:mannan endo-1,4-beta-mannosidase n=1 Tax=Madurella fahalii TaxID=1157608 RepID=A0ABQ0FX42_9PEZI